MSSELRGQGDVPRMPSLSQRLALKQIHLKRKGRPLNMTRSE
jgi:hypothetical protein